MHVSYREYPDYKDPGIEWVGDIPKHWDVNPVFAVCSEKEVKNSQGEESNVLSLSYGRIIPRNVEDNYGLIPESFNTYQIVLPGDVILRLTDLQNDKRSLRVGLVKGKGIITSAYLCLKSGAKLLPEYLYSLLHSFDTTKVFYGMGGGLRQSMKFADMRRMPLLTPPLEEQQAIVAYISHETAKIDRLIEKQKQLIELLKEKRQAVISHAVTKGLDPNVKMKDSGVEWLGRVPEHWELKRLKYIGKSIIGLTYSPEDIADDENGKLVLRASNIKAEKLVFEDNVYVTKQIPDELITKSGDILICARSGSRDLVGKSAIIEADFAGLSFGAFMTVFRSSANRYLAWVLRSSLFEYQSGSFTTSTINQLTSGTLNSFEVPLPTESERNEIAAYLERRTGEIDTLASKAESAIKFMRERRVALISAVVTGKIDVRNWRADAKTAA